MPTFMLIMHADWPSAHGSRPVSLYLALMLRVDEPVASLLLYLLTINVRGTAEQHHDSQTQLMWATWGMARQSGAQAAAEGSGLGRVLQRTCNNLKTGRAKTSGSRHADLYR